MDPRSVNQQAADLGMAAAPLAPPMGALEKISPIVEYLLQMLSGGGQQKPFTSSQMTQPYMGPRPTSQQTLRGSMMPQGYMDPATVGGKRDPNVMY